ncbi:hypothetical protein VSH64_45885 [Amycolatopsis rhabdoformis]|uniref:Uncharacterized protein n=1 Tax=Amycolatopsis rhabdoformis TaxID=1448059 RepID=A0ABZ1I851_9PSEU|nr:hypothetical protein [Amycolatopsis rhabdoformis]WSE30048.1 hypothetical protein VSH64_45885 [Amycolatopsis rhabdoformis]
MTDRIAALWRAGTAPAHDGLYRADDTAFAIDTNGAALSWFDLGPRLDLDEVLADPHDVIEIDEAARAEIADGVIVCGPGELGADGFFARLDPTGNLCWLVASTRSNPFERIAISGTVVEVTDNLGNSVAFDLLDPHFAR